MTKYKDVPSREHRAFFRKAEEWAEAARSSTDAGNYNAAVPRCVHSATNTVDVAAVPRAGRRAAGGRTDSLCLIRSVFAGQDSASLERQCGFLPG